VTWWWIWARREGEDKEGIVARMEGVKRGVEKGARDAYLDERRSHMLGGVLIVKKMRVLHICGLQEPNVCVCGGGEQGTTPNELWRLFCV